METKVYNQKGVEVSSVKVPAGIFGLKWNADLVHQVATSLYSNERPGLAHTKGRGEVQGGGKKPWRQKGTGRARHGSIRSPIWRGGGVTHGPIKDKNYKKKINKKMKIQSFFMVLSDKFKKGNVLFVDKIDLKDIKTKDASAIALSLSKIKGFEKIAHKKTAAELILPGKNAVILKSFRNIPSIYINQIGNLNTLEILRHKLLILVDPEKCIKALENKKK